MNKKGIIIRQLYFEAKWQAFLVDLPTYIVNYKTDLMYKKGIFVTQINIQEKYQLTDKRGKENYVICNKKKSIT